MLTRFRRSIKNEEETTEKPKPNPEDVGQQAGQVAQDVIEILTGSAQEIVALFSEIFSSVGTVLEETLPPSAWSYLCVATWWPLHEQHCAESRCAACSPAVMSAVSVCKTVQTKLSHKCVQLVMGEGFCNYCIADVV